MASLPLFIINPINAQRLATTQDGDLVLLYDDGSWSYAPNNQVETSRQSQCNFVVNLIMPESGEKQTVLQKATFISHTEDNIKKEKQWQDFVICEVAIGELDGSKMAYIEFTFQTPYAYRYYGIIQEGRSFYLKLEDNTVVELEFNLGSKGMVDSENNQTIYRTFTLLSKKQIELLRRSKVKEALMPWTRGNEKYPVLYQGLFMDMLPCLD